jgi:hypothetical protein
MERNEMTVSDALEKLVMIELDARRRGETDYANGIQQPIGDRKTMIKLDYPGKHVWRYVAAKTPSGKTRTVRKCEVCAVVTYPHYGATRWVYPDGRCHQSNTVDQTSCDGDFQAYMDRRSVEIEEDYQSQLAEDCPRR